ncbi:DUF2267 domain-containing protein [Halobiforma nitratireducens]|uniref:DUF2267 domain-containing protein n=1 Tax=Halobiforma nitratireducens JCM 10879 TaxID=1227454 RepID=M0MCC7_9EURY|nr:DUF2267 domain-containing protein [Halobiforma nitratireducens]EMA42329.1 hypothetical protein C446_04360 [Halobiforma nitratireducens JCM 10879]
MATSYNDFVGEVQHRVEAGTQAEAVRTIRAVLQTLGERVGEGGATDIAGPLPMEIDRYLLAADHGHTFGFDEFVDRVQAKLNYDDLDLEAAYGTPGDVDPAEAVYRSQAVIELVSQLVPGGDLANVENQLPAEFDDLFEFVDAETKPWDTRE